MKYFAVTCKCGHAGAGKHVALTFAIAAEDGAHAAKKAVKLPSVKHHSYGDILSLKEITLEEYNERRQTSTYAPRYKTD